MGKDILSEAERLWGLGFAVIWLRPKSKIPVEGGWTTGVRKDWAYLEKTYRPGFNVGVRLGTPSKIGKNYLAVLDVDIKKPGPEILKKALDAARAVLGEKNNPVVASGRGGGSCHFYFLTEKPFKTWNPESNEDFEISLYSDGRQVVLPPSVHPVSGLTYKWALPFNPNRVPVIKVGRPSPKSAALSGVVLEDFKVSPVELGWLDLSDSVRKAIIDGEGVTDRSNYLLRASSALYSSGLTRNEVLTVLTDPTIFMGQVGYEHAGNTKSRKRAAGWVYRFTARKVEEERDPKKVFTGEARVPRKLSFDEMVKQSEGIEEERDWRQSLKRTAKGESYKPGFMNSLLIFENEFGKELFHKDDFSLRRTYGVDTEWGGEKGRELNDEDITAMRRYVCEKYGFELEEKHIIPTITSISSRNHHHPVREYLDSLKWDGVPRIDFWLRDFAGVRAVPEYLETISRKVLCAMVARAYIPGLKFDYVLILEGPNQGEGKSRSIRALAGPDWAGTVRFDMDHKDFVLALQGRWVTEISELSGLGKKNTAFVKAIVSEESDRIRHPYGRFTETLPRQGIFIGTTNHFQYLEDETGNRRFWPVRVGSKIDVDGLTEIRDQLFAEAKVVWEKGEPLYIENRQIEKLARDAQSSRMSEDSWEQKLKDFFNLKKDEEKVYTKFKISDLFANSGPLQNNLDSEANLKRVCRALRRLGYYPKDMKGEKGHGKYWVKSEDEIG